jgi:ubiquinone/menaquinone biosynthesis C-methylase UbiE
MSAPSSNAPSPQKFLQYSFGYAAPLILEAAVRHGLFDHLAAGPQSADELAAMAKISRRGARILLNALVGLEVLTKDASGRYSHTPDSAEFLVSTKPGYIGGFLKHTSSQLIPKWLKLTEVVKTGKPATAVNQEGDGSAFFSEFVEDLFPVNYRAASALGDALKLSEAKGPVRVLDLAAGSGVWGIALAQKSPHVRVTALDWPGVLTTTRKVAAKHGVGDRFQFVPGDLDSADFGSGYQVATLGHILHSEGVERSKSLIGKTFRSLASGGAIAIAEWLVNDERRQPPPGLIFAVNMLVNTDAGDTFSFSEIREWLEQVGFRDARLLEVPGISPLVLAIKP